MVFTNNFKKLRKKKPQIKLKLRNLLNLLPYPKLKVQ
jgi:hypothetical protein